MARIEWTRVLGTGGWEYAIEWTRVLGTSGWEYAHALTTGLDGSIFIAGFTEGNLDGQFNSGGRDAFITKYNPDGTKAWTRLLGTSGWDSAFALTTGLDGSIFVAGLTEGNLDGQIHSGRADAFITKYNPDGTKAWTRLLGTSEWDSAFALTTGLDGSIFVAGSTFGNLDGQINSRGFGDAFITKYNPDGTKAWTRLLGTSSGDIAYALTTGLDGSIFVAGSTEGNLDGQTNSGDWDAFITKYNPDGTRVWTRLLGTSSYDGANALTTGLDGSIYVAGSTSGNLDGQINSGGERDVFITKYNPDGTRAWTRLLGTSDSDAANALTTGLDGSIYVAGETGGNLDGQINGGGGFITKYNPNGTKAWTRLLGTSSSYYYAKALTTGLDGIYIAGIALPDIFNFNNSGYDAVITKFKLETVTDVGTLVRWIERTGTLNPGEVRYYRFDLPTLPGQPGRYQPLTTSDGNFHPFELNINYWDDDSVFDIGFSLLDANRNPISVPGFNDQNVVSPFQPGTYYYQITAPQNSQKPITYRWNTALTGIGALVIDDRSPFPVTQPIAIRSFENNPINFENEIWLISHGWNGKPDNPNFTELAKEVNRQGYQALLIDWSVPAAFVSSTLHPGQAAVWIQDVATFAADALGIVWDITASDLNLIGHSLGSYLSAEIGGIFAGITSGGREGDDRPVQKDGTTRINRLIALDPAASVNFNFSYDISNNDGAASTKPYDFREVANFSRAFWGGISITRGDGTGNQNRAATAHESFQVRFDQMGAVQNHSNITRVYTELISSTNNKIDQKFSLDDSQRIETVAIGGIPLFLAENAYNESDEGILHVRDNGRTSYKLEFQSFYGLPGTIIITPEEGYFQRVRRKIAIDGYIDNAIIFLDVNGNRQLDDNEASSSSISAEFPPLLFDETQLAALVNATALPTLVLLSNQNTIDLATGLNFQTLLTAPSNATVVTPLTTIIAKLQKAGSSIEEAETGVKTFFGIDANIDLLSYDSIQGASQGDTLATTVYAGDASVQNAVTQIVNFLKGASGQSLAQLSLFAFDAIAQQLTNADFSLTQANSLAHLITATASLAEIELSPEQIQVLDQVATIIAAGQQQIAALNSLDPVTFLQETVRIQRVSQGEVAIALQGVGQNPTTIDAVLTQHTGVNLEAQIATAQIANLFRPVFVNPTAIFSTAKNTTAVGTIEAAIDHDPEDILTYSLSGVDADKFDFNPITRVLNFKTAPDFETPGSEAVANTYGVTITATDTAGLMATQTVIVNVTDINNNDTPPVEGDRQQITSLDNLTATAGGNVSIPLFYNTSTGDNTVTGLSLRLHYNSNELSFQTVENLFSNNLFIPLSNRDDTSDFDNDPNTNKFIQFGYAEFAGNWPNQTLPLKLGDFNFTTTGNFTGTQLNLTSDNLAPNYSLEADPILVSKQEWNFDIDGNGEIKALSDGIMIIRHLFGSTAFPGEKLTEGAIASNATRNLAEIQAYLQQGVDNKYLDIDGNGEIKALSDGIMIIRHLFGSTAFPDEKLIEGAIASDATRDLSQIQAHLTQFSTVI